MSRKPTKRAPSDVTAGKAWEAIMEIATQNCLIVNAYGGVATLAMPDEQRKAGLRERILLAHCCHDHKYDPIVAHDLLVRRHLRQRQTSGRGVDVLTLQEVET